MLKVFFPEMFFFPLSIFFVINIFLVVYDFSLMLNVFFLKLYFFSEIEYYILHMINIDQFCVCSYLQLCVHCIQQYYNKKRNAQCAVSDAVQHCIHFNVFNMNKHKNSWYISPFINVITLR